MFNLKPWSSDSLTEEQRARYQIERVGESFHSGRPTFKVVCQICNQVLHKNTNNPSHHIEVHEETCKEPVK